jgi:hypothetical protein
MPFQYKLWGCQVVSDFNLGELEPASVVTSISGTLRVNSAREEDWPQPRGPALLEDRSEDGDLRFVSYKSGDAYIARFSELCSFRIHPNRMSIDCAPHPEIAESTIAHLILDQAIPRLLALKTGYLVLHASAIQVEDQVIAVLGSSGKGKSTLAGWFASQGHKLLTDDCLLLVKDDATQQWMAQPSYQSVRLWPDSVAALGIETSALREFAGYSSKRRTGTEVDFRYASKELPLKTCFVLSDPESGMNLEQPEVLPLPVNEAFLAVAKAVFRLDASDQQINRSEFEALTSLSNAVDFWSLSYERKYDWLPEVEKAIIQTIQGTNGRKRL